MAELSPTAQAVMKAYEDSGVLRGPALAAALRAAADQVTPANGSRRNNEIRADIFAIAAELDNPSPTSEEK
jgi:hypothetical protein